MTSVLIVEDEESLADPLAFLLRKEGFEATVVTDGPAALAEFDRAGADIVLLDLMLPGMSGTDVCKQLRARSSVPVIMVTARDSEIDKVVGLELGADDYVTKPYSARELIARIRAVLRRGGDDDSEMSDGVLESGPVRMDVERHVVSVNGDTITLPLKEFDLLEYLMRNSGRVLTRGQLIDRVWGADYVGDTKTLDVHVKRLRSKIEADPANPVHLVTVRGLGYKLEASGRRQPWRLSGRYGQCHRHDGQLRVHFRAAGQDRGVGNPHALDAAQPARRVDRTKLLVGAGGRGARRMEGGQVQASGVGSAQHILQLGQGPHRWGAGDTGQHLHRAGGKEQPANGLQRDP